jgi:hypothetical protein
MRPLGPKSCVIFFDAKSMFPLILSHRDADGCESSPEYVVQKMLRLIERGKRTIGATLLKDWTGSALCGKLVKEYLENTQADYSLFSGVCGKLAEIAAPLERAADTIRQISSYHQVCDETDRKYEEAIGLVRLSRQLEAGLAEISYVAEWQGRRQVEVEYRSKSLFFQCS